MTPVRPLLGAALALFALGASPAPSAFVGAPPALDDQASDSVPAADDAADAWAPERLDEQGLQDALASLVALQPELVHVRSLASSPAGRDVPVVVVGAAGAPLPERRGLLVVAGADGRRLSDTRLALELLHELLGGDDPAAALGEHVVVVVPRLEPDAAAAALGEGGPRREQLGNGRPDDADRDGRTDEDGADDLDGDGAVTWMRVLDGAGEWVIDEHDPRAMRKADRAKGERGTHRLLREGRDDDGDGESGEDGADGVRLDRNFPHGWPEHEASSGAFALSEPVTAALAWLVHEHPGLLAVLDLGAEDTLVSLPKKAKDGSSRYMRALLDGVHADDVASLEEWQRRFDEAGAKELAAKADALHGGGLLAWAYHQRGRWPLGVRAWSPPESLDEASGRVEAARGDDDGGDDDDDDGDDLPESEDEPFAVTVTHGHEEVPVIQEAVVTTVTEVTGDVDLVDEATVVELEAMADAAADRVQEAIEESSDDASEDADHAADDDADAAADDDAPKPTSDEDSPVPAAVLAWLDGVHDGAGFAPWTAVEHDEFDEVEVGGLLPGTLVDPPYADVAELAAPLARFVLEGLAAYPSLAFEDVAMTRHGGGVYTLELALVNTGVLPTHPRLAADTRTQRPIRIRLGLPEGVERVNGPEQVLVDRLEGGGGRRELRWVLAGAGSGVRVSVTADCDIAADVTEEIILP